jgi:hypothetical protein
VATNRERLHGRTDRIGGVVWQIDHVMMSLTRYQPASGQQKVSIGVSSGGWIVDGRPAGGTMT